MSILLTNDLDKKRFASAITNICKSTIHRDASIQREAILQKVFSKSKMTTEEQNNFLDNLTKLLSLATKKGWTHQELTDATKNTELVTIAEEQGDILGQFWKSESININVSIAEASTFAQKLETFTWRIDMKSSGGDGSNDEPCALLEMNVTDRVRCCWICWLSVVILCFCVLRQNNGLTFIILYFSFVLSFFIFCCLQSTESNVTPVVFEMNKDQVSELQRQVKEIQNVISSSV